MESNVKYGQETGVNLIKIAKKLLKNQNLCKLLVNTDKDPLNPVTHPDEINGLTLLHKNIRVIPLILADEQNISTKIVVFFAQGEINSYNSDNESLSLYINIYCPFQEWKIAGDNLRPFAVMSEIRKSLQDKRINGLGEILYEGFQMDTVSEEMGIYSMRFKINAFS